MMSNHKFDYAISCSNVIDIDRPLTWFSALNFIKKSKKQQKTKKNNQFNYEKSFWKMFFFVIQKLFLIKFLAILVVYYFGISYG